MNHKVTMEDMQLEFPTSLREIIADELHDAVDEGLKAGREVKPITDIEGLMKRVYAHIEKQALATYHSSEPWALRMWALSNILKEEVVNEATAEMAHGLISDVIGWQEQQDFDPLTHFSDQIQDLSPKTIKGYLLTASRFVGFIGRKRYYSDEDVISYLKMARKRYDNDNTYQQEGIRLLQLLRSLGDDNRKLPGKKSESILRGLVSIQWGKLPIMPLDALKSHFGASGELLQSYTSGH